MDPETKPQPLLSIVTIHKGDEESLIRTLNSMVHLGPLKEFTELIVVNANSYEYIFNDDSFLRYKQFVSINSGIFHAMNFGLEKSIGAYTVFVNSGDLISDQLDPNLILIHLKKRAIWFVAKSKRFNFRRKNLNDWILPKNYLKFYFAINSYCHQSTFVDRKHLALIGGFVESNSVADWEVSLNLHQIQKPEIVDTYWAEYAGNGFSDSPDMKVWAEDVSASRARSGLFVFGGVKVDRFFQRSIAWLLTVKNEIFQNKSFRQ
jgi:hypothetical protein